MPDEQLTLILKLRDEATAQMKSARAGIIAAGAAIAAAGFSAGKKWEDATKTIIDGTGATGDALKVLQGDYQAVAKYGDGAATAIADLNTHLGLQGEELQLVAEKALKMSADTNAVGESLGHIVSQGGDANAFLDVFHAALQSSGVEADRMQRQINKAIPRLEALGFSAEETVAHVIELANKSGHEGLIPALAEAEKALRQGGDVLGDYSALALESAGSIERSYEAASSWRRSLQQAKDALIAYIGPAGDILGALGATASGLALAGPQMLKWIKGLTLAAIGSKAAAASMGLLAGAVAVLTSPITAIIGILVAVGGAYYVFQDQIGDALRRAEQSAKDFYLGVKEWLSCQLGPIFDKLITSAEFLATVLFRHELASWRFLTSVAEGSKEAADETDAFAEEQKRLAAEALAAALALQKLKEEEEAAAKAALEAAAALTAQFEAVKALGAELGFLQRERSLEDIAQGWEDSLGEMPDLFQGVTEELEALGQEAPKAAQSASKLDVTLAALAGGIGGASGQGISLLQAMRETNAALEEGERGFSKMQMGAALAGGALQDLSDEFDGVGRQALSAASNIAAGFATGGPVGAAIAAGLEVIKGLFGGPDAVEHPLSVFHKALAEAAADAWESAAQSAVSAFKAAQDAGQDAYDSTLTAALRSGLGQEEAIAQATAAQIAASAEVLAVRGAEYARLAAFDAAMALGAHATAEERGEAARRGAQVAIDSWAAATDAIAASDQAATDAMLGNHAALTDQVVEDAGRMVTGIESHLSGLAQKDWQIDLDYRQHGIPGRQHGGPVSAGSPVKVGEAGPEIFVPSSSGSIVPNKSIPTAEEIGAAVAAAMRKTPIVVPQDPVTDALYRNGPRRAALHGYGQ